jgi:hypothetical protein
MRRLLLVELVMVRMEHCSRVVEVVAMVVVIVELGAASREQK